MARPKEFDEGRALQRSMTTENATIFEILDRGAPARDRLRAVLDQAADAPDAEPAGCLVLDSTVELAPHDTAVRATLRADQDRSLAALTATITDGQRAGEITTDPRPRPRPVPDRDDQRHARRRRESSPCRPPSASWGCRSSPRAAPS